MLSITRDDGYTISTDPGRIDVDRVHRWLSGDAYWALGRTRETVVRSIEGSVPFGIYRPGDGTQVGFARAVTDRATFCWICDVFVDPDERGRGLGGWLVGAVRDEATRLGVYRLMLATADAHGLYTRLGFGPLPRPDTYMELDQRPGTTPNGSTTGTTPNEATAGTGRAGSTAEAVTVATTPERKDLDPGSGLTVGA